MLKGHLLQQSIMVSQDDNGCPSFPHFPPLSEHNGRPSFQTPQLQSAHEFLRF